MTQLINWITDRRPTAADADEDGEVVLRRFADGRKDSTAGKHDALVDWRHVGAGVPWRRTGVWQPPATPEPKPTKPALAVGQRWRRRDGEVVTVTEHDHDVIVDYPFSATIAGVGEHWYCADGTSCLKNPNYDLIELLTPEPDPTPTPRKFASISRTVTDFGHTIDAIDDDGVAWWMTTALDDDSGREWHQLLPLPGRGVA